MTRQETVLNLWSTFPLSQAYGTFSAFRGICRAFGEGHGRKQGLHGADCIGTILLLSPAIIDLWASTGNMVSGGRRPLILGYRKEDHQPKKIECAL